jgi:hypothetical protein
MIIGVAKIAVAERRSTHLICLEAAAATLERALDCYITTCALFVTDDPTPIADSLSGRWGPYILGSMRLNIVQAVVDMRNRARAVKQFAAR